ncbi:DeoR family transcriptional regulator [Pasteurella skyensis]|uniref:DeoR family transcriptional regulator n=1 Tax=Phocoenobacter skyensis TaxID=97481 RepID=A0AAJ6NE32_9PAST|nr:DeoR family transcriptional regulator [Pasteurella skyensis]MDP8169708.1 DeoR family transcriptional regulator [Pasteurella skyensis]MDP8175123.1 DeoR family transcriptional regulator [Pasteurella skyensis]
MIDSYERLLAFGQKHLNDLFFLDGIHNISARDCILREIISNTLVHRDYSSGFPARIIIDNEAITIENSNLAHKMGTLDLLQFKPYPKNPTISKVFREMGLADELDSGMRNTYKYTKLCSDSIPLFEEGNIFKTIIPLRKIATQKVGNASQNVPHNVSQDVSHNVPKNITPYSKEERILIIKKYIKENNKITRKAIADELGVDLKTIQRDINKIDNLKYIGRGRNGHWEFEE